MDTQPRTRLRIAFRYGMGWSYAEVAADLDGVSEHEVSTVVNWLEEQAAQSNPDDVMKREIEAGVGDLAAYGPWE